MQRRRISGLVLCALGTALIVLAPLLHWWVGPALTKSPVGGEVVSDASGDNVTYIDFADPNLRQQTGTVRSREVYQGVTADSTSKVAVYNLSAETYFTDQPDLSLDIQAGQQRFAIDRKTGMAVADPKGQEKVDSDVNNAFAKHCGLILKFPLGTKKESYPFWDTANLHYASERTVWVDPVTGVIIKGQQTVAVTLGAPSDPAKTTVLNGTLTFTPDNVKDSAKRAKDGQAKINLIGIWLPLICLLIGILVLVAGLLLVRPGSTAEPAVQPSPVDEPTATFPA